MCDVRSPLSLDGGGRMCDVQSPLSLDGERARVRVKTHPRAFLIPSRTPSVFIKTSLFQNLKTL